MKDQGFTGSLSVVVVWNENQKTPDADISIRG